MNLRKLSTWRRQDQADIERMLRECEGLDEDYIVRRLEPLAEETGTAMRARWSEISGSR